jgi:hypothetical protein
VPAPLRDRQADNWRPLIAIADAFGADWATRAREAAVFFASQHQDEDAAVVLLRDIRDIFDCRAVDRLASETIVDHLNGTDDALWSEWRGVQNNQQPHKLSQGELAKLLELRRAAGAPLPATRQGKSRSRRAHCRALADRPPASSRVLQSRRIERGDR